MISESGPEHKISRCASLGFRGNPACNCCTGHDKKGRKVHPRYQDFSDAWFRNLNAYWTEKAVRAIVRKKKPHRMLHRGG